MSLLDDADDWMPRLAAACAKQRGRASTLPRPERPNVVHTLYWGAHRFVDGSLPLLAAQARDIFERYAPDPASFAGALGLGAAADAAAIHGAVARKLAREPIEDLRLDFEDGYGIRPDVEEDATAVAAARALAKATQAGDAPRASGIRIKPLTPDLLPRSLRTLERFVRTLTERLDGALPPGFVVTLPKVTVVEQLTALDALLGRLEEQVGLAPGAIDLEFMVEVPGAVFDSEGRLLFPQLLAAASSRVVGVHLGVYDFTAAYGVAAMHQAMDHPACDLVRGLMGLAFSDSGRVLSAGSTHVLPVGLHPEGDALDEAQRDANRIAVHRGWRLAHGQIRHTLVRGYYHGWDLHPAQLPARFAACYGFYLEGVDAAADRLRDYLAATTAATDDAAVLDDVATGQALLNFFRRGHACGAFDEGHVAAAGLTVEELGVSSFAELLARRRAYA